MGSVAFCATHPGVPAKLACARCGSFGCERCTMRTSCKDCLEKVRERNGLRVKVVRALGLSYAIEAALLCAGALAVARPFGAALFVALVGALPLLIVGFGLFRFDPRARIVGSAMALGPFLVSKPFGLLVASATVYGLLVPSAKEVFSPLYAEACEVELPRKARWLSWAPFGLFLAIALPLTPLLALGVRRPLLMHSEDLVPFAVSGSLFAMLFLFSAGAGWTGRARTQLMLWASIGISGYQSGWQGGGLCALVLFVLIFAVGKRQRFPVVNPIHEQAVDVTGFKRLKELRAFLTAHGFRPFAQLFSAFRTGTIGQDVYLNEDGVLCLVTAASSGSFAVYTVSLETRSTDGRSVRSCNEIRSEEVNDPERHPIYYRVLDSYDALLAYHLEHAHELGPTLAPAHATEYLQMRRQSYLDSFRSAQLRGIVYEKGGEYRFTALGCLRLIRRSFDLVGALATERKC
jgi:hypothetical protein